MFLQKYPPGLLSMLDLKSGGAAPNDFAGSVIGVLDLEKFYRSSQRSAISQDANVTNAGDTNVVTVPSGKTWLLEHYSATVGMAIGDTQLCGRLFIALATGGARVSMGSIRHIQAGLAATANWSVESMAPSLPLLLPAGTQIGFILEAGLPGARSSALRGLITEFDV